MRSNLVVRCITAFTVAALLLPGIAAASHVGNFAGYRNDAPDTPDVFLPFIGTSVNASSSALQTFSDPRTFREASAQANFGTVGATSISYGDPLYAIAYSEDRITLSGGVGMTDIILHYDFGGCLGNANGTLTFGTVDPTPCSLLGSGYSAVRLRDFTFTGFSDLFNIADYMGSSPASPPAIPGGLDLLVADLNGNGDFTDDAGGFIDGSMPVFATPSMRLTVPYDTPFDIGLMLEVWAKDGGVALFGSTGTLSLEVPTGTFVTSETGAFQNVIVSSVPVPAAAWLFGSGLLGLIGLARCKKSA